MKIFKGEIEREKLLVNQKNRIKIELPRGQPKSKMESLIIETENNVFGENSIKKKQKTQTNYKCCLCAGENETKRNDK